MLKLGGTVDTYTLPDWFLPTNLFQYQSAMELERNQDVEGVLSYTDGFLKPAILEVSGTKRFVNSAEKAAYIQELSDVVQSTNRIEYDNYVAILASKVWLEYEISQTKPLTVEFKIKLVPFVSDYELGYPDDIRMFRGDILMNRSDVTMETLRGV